MDLMVAVCVYGVTVVTIISGAMCIKISQDERARKRRGRALDLRGALHLALDLWDNARRNLRRTHPHLPDLTRLELSSVEDVYQIIPMDAPHTDKARNLRVTVFNPYTLALIKDTVYTDESGLPDTVRSKLLLLSMVDPEFGMNGTYYIPSVGIRSLGTFYVFDS